MSKEELGEAGLGRTARLRLRRSSSTRRSGSTWTCICASGRSSRGGTLRRKDPKDVKPEFKDRQLEAALDYLRSQIKTAAQVPTKKAG